MKDENIDASTEYALSYMTGKLAPLQHPRHESHYRTLEKIVRGQSSNIAARVCCLRA
jgi:hypothetical protein